MNLVDKPLKTIKPNIRTVGVSADALLIDTKLDRTEQHYAKRATATAVTREPQSLDEKLFDSRAHFKRHISQVAMHLDNDWRVGLFAQIDSLLDVDEWDEEDIPVVDLSHKTAIRGLLFLNPNRRPGLGITPQGELLLSWADENKQLTITCMPYDRVRWLIRSNDNDEPESAAGITSAKRLKDVLSPYNVNDLFG